MRSLRTWHRQLTDELRPVWRENLAMTPASLLDVELGLHLLTRVLPDKHASDVWTLLGGYPYAEVFGEPGAATHQLVIRRARHHLWPLRRRRVWHRMVTSYLGIPLELRGFDLGGLQSSPTRLLPTRAAHRFAVFDQLLSDPPPFERIDLPLAKEGEYLFNVRERSYSVHFDENLAGDHTVTAHDLASPLHGKGRPVVVNKQQLEDAAAEMDRREASLPAERRSNWLTRMERNDLLGRSPDGQRFETGHPLTVEKLTHLVGMVGAGKSTLRDILTFWAARRGLRVTIVVGDVAEALAVVGRFNALGEPAAPILGHSTRERHIQRLHRRLATAGAESMLAHEHPGFHYANSACAVDALRGLEAAQPLRIGEAPCTNLRPAGKPAPGTTDALFDVEGQEDVPEPPRSVTTTSKAPRHGCPLWERCPRHHGARELVAARIWVATPASLVHSGVPLHQVRERIRYLELACRHSDLVIVDEADRVQMQLDSAFAPSATLVGRSPDSWLDEVNSHKITEMARQGRLQLSERDIDEWTSALNTVSIAADRLYALLVQNKSLRDWIVEDYFSAFTLHLWLLNAWFPNLNDLDSHEPDDPRIAERDRLDAILDRFRDNPLTENPSTNPPTTRPDTQVDTINHLVRLTLELLHARPDSPCRERLRDTLLSLVPGNEDVARELDANVLRLELTLILAALHHSLDIMTTLWPRVETALNLDSATNVLSRRPPRDYEPIIPESPMGNVLGFQFQLDERTRTDGPVSIGQSGSLRFFRCSGIGRELLLNLSDLPTIDNRPSPHVLLMSATSWSGESSRYHVHVPVSYILRPRESEVSAVLGTTFRKDFLYGPNDQPLRLSGSNPADRPAVLEHMLRQLAEADPSLTGATSKLADELNDIPDPERRRVLLLVGSYAEARRAADYLNGLAEWTGRVTLLVSDDADLDDVWHALPRDPGVATLRRGDVSSFARTGGEILVAPLLAVERGHNIVLPDGKAAIGTVYFLARPHPRPGEISLAMQSINDWAVRSVRGGTFHHLCRGRSTPDAAGLAFRALARKKWQRFLTRKLAWSSLEPDEKAAFTWDQLVVMWQVIGRLVRGGVAARVVFVDAAFSPLEAGLVASDTPATSLLLSMRQVLAPYFTDDPTTSPLDRSLVTALYEPLYTALCRID